MRYHTNPTLAAGPPCATPHPTMRHALTLTIAIIISLAGCWNWTGANHAKATQEARTYTQKAKAAGTDITFVGCTKHDTDGDGYLACDFIIEGKPVTLDCAGKSLVQDNTGCKAYVAKLRMVNGGSQ